MPSSPAAKVVEHLRMAMQRHEEDQLSDGQLLDRYIEKRDDAAFAALVRRHGAMVIGAAINPHKGNRGNKQKRRELLHAFFAV